MKIREAHADDKDALLALHRGMGHSYSLPDTDSPLFVSKWMLTTDEGVPAQAILGRLTVESYFLMDKRIGSPEQRWQWFQDLHKISAQHGRALGLQDVHCWLPPSVAERFGKRLMSIGFLKPMWPDYFLPLET